MISSVSGGVNSRSFILALISCFFFLLANSIDSVYILFLSVGVMTVLN